LVWKFGINGYVLNWFKSYLPSVQTVLAM